MERADDDQESNYDLPLLANVDEILIRHYAINLSCDFAKKQLSGHVILFLDLLPREQIENRAQLILDCKDITIESVESVDFDNDDEFNRILKNSSAHQPENIERWLKMTRQPLHFKNTEWSVNIWSDSADAGHFPRVVCIAYVTTECGTSLTWTRDQDGRCCVFTQGALVNNRSLVPCQEPPVAMATWQCGIETEDGVVVLMSGDRGAVVRRIDGGRVWHYCWTRIVAPISTLALAIGYWGFVEVVTESEAMGSSKVELSTDDNSDEKCLHESFPCHVTNESNRKLLPCRLFAPAKLLENAKKELCEQITRYMDACSSLLGCHPFARLDVLVAPRCFGSLGLANPHLLFVSQSLICGDGSMAIHIAHELCHSWFGLSIGALDWTEEWLSEGFATYMEDQVHSMALNWSDKEHHERCEIRSLLRHRLLAAEIDNTDEELQVLRRDNDATKLSNGANPLKCLSQVHYLKGYFLLRRLASRVGEAPFNRLLRDYVNKHHGCLISSKQIFQLYFDRFPRVQDLTMENIYRDWLDFPGMPKDLCDFGISSDNSVYRRVVDEVGKWKALNRNNSRRVKTMRLQMELNQLDGDELVLFLELMLEIKRLCAKTLTLMSGHFGLEKRNAHIKHRWLELVVKHEYCKGYGALREFLEEDQSMGVYLYSELINSGIQNQLQLAQSTFNHLRHQMDIPQRKTIEKMLKLTKNR